MITRANARNSELPKKAAGLNPNWIINLFVALFCFGIRFLVQTKSFT